MAKIWRILIKFFGRLYFRLGRSASRRPKDYIPASGKVLGSAELDAMLDASLDLWLTAGRFNQKFERELAAYLGVPAVFTTNSGSSANLLALASLQADELGPRRLRPGDEIITAAVSFPTTVAPIVQLGCVPVFIDCLPDGNLDPGQLAKAYSSRTKAVVAAHILGKPFAVEAVKDFCTAHDLWLIEDVCDALGGIVQGRKLGTWGDLATFSFYPAHHITMGEGGAVAVNHPLLKKIVLSLRDWGRDCHCPPGQDNCCGQRFRGHFGQLPAHYDHKYVYGRLGFNLKITDWQAALGGAQLKRLPYFLAKRRQNAAYLTQHLADLQDDLILPTEEAGTEAAWFGYMVGVKNPRISQDALVTYLETQGIGTRPLFAGNILRQPLAASGFKLRIGGQELKTSNQLTEADFALLPQTDLLMRRYFWVGIYPGLTFADLAKTAGVLHTGIRELTN